VDDLTEISLGHVLGAVGNQRLERLMEGATARKSPTLQGKKLRKSVHAAGAKHEGKTKRDEK
jgi:hypothetical protein